MKIPRRGTVVDKKSIKSTGIKGVVNQATVVDRKSIKSIGIKGVVNQGMLLHAAQLKMIKPRKRERVTFFGDQTEIIIKSQSKKKIFF